MEKVFRLNDEGYTLASLMDNRLFSHGACFAACVVPHPQDTFLNIHIASTSSTPEEVLSKALESIRRDLRAMLASLEQVQKKNQAHTK